MSKPLVSIITVNYNHAEVTCALLESIRRQEYRSVEVIVVDNGSLDDPKPILTTRYPEIGYLRSARNLGFAGGNNLGLEKAQGDYLFFVNNDAELLPGTIARLVDFLQQTPNCGIVSPLICYFPMDGAAEDIIQYAGMTPVHPITARNRLIGHQEKDRGQFSQPRITAYAHGAAMMVSRAVLNQAGPMADDFFLYYEELDWCERIRRAGYTVWVEPRARVYHKESLTVQALGALKTYYLNRNRLYFMRRNAGKWPLRFFYTYLWLVLVPKNLAAMSLNREWANLRAFWQGIWWNFGLKNNPWEMRNATPALNYAERPDLKPAITSNEHII